MYGNLFSSETQDRAGPRKGTFAKDYTPGTPTTPPSKTFFFGGRFPGTLYVYYKYPQDSNLQRQKLGNLSKIRNSLLFFISLLHLSWFSISSF